MSLPSNWEGNHIDLYVEGAYSVATYYLNGHLLGTHATGYTSAIFRLDNATGLQFGAGSENILAIYIDATAKACTGWWCVMLQLYSAHACAEHAKQPTHLLMQRLLKLTCDLPMTYNQHHTYVIKNKVRGRRSLQKHVLDFNIAAPRCAARRLCTGLLLQRLQDAEHACNGHDCEQCFPPA